MKKVKLTNWLYTIFGVMPRIKIWSEVDDWNGVKFYWNDKVMRLMMKKLCGVHIEFGDIKINIYIPYGA